MARPSVALSVRVDGDQEVARILTGVRRDVQDWRPAWKTLEGDFRGVIEKQFESEGARSGQAWQPLSPAYSVQKVSTWGPQPILVASGDLKSSLTTKGPGNFQIVEKQSLGIGTDISYAKYHQSRAARTRLARRPFIAPTEDDKRGWVRILQRHIFRKVRRGL